MPTPVEKRPASGLHFTQPAEQCTVTSFHFEGLKAITNDAYFIKNKINIYTYIVQIYLRVSK